MLNFKKYINDIKKRGGRTPEFKCSICGKFLSYDRRTVIVNYYTKAIFDYNEEQWFPEDVTEFIHKKCLTKSKVK